MPLGVTVPTRSNQNRMFDVVFYEAFEEEAREIKEFLPRNVHAKITPNTIQEEGETTPLAKLVCVRTQSLVPKEWAADIDAILTRSQGYDHLIRYRRESQSNINCGYLGDYCSRAVAEQAILMMMAIARKLKKQAKNFCTFSRDGLTGFECKGKNALVVGVGNIGSEIVETARGLGMTVKGVDINPKMDTIEYMDLSKGMVWADIVFCALPLTEETDRMFQYAAFKEAQAGMIFINIARGEISPLEDLKRLLDEGKIGGLGLDVYSHEDDIADVLRSASQPRSSEIENILALAERDNVYFTPHNAFNTKEALKKKAVLTVEAVVSYLENKTFPFPLPLR